MSKYKITVEEVVENDDKYASDITIYQQTVTGDESLVNEVAKTVLEYNSHLTQPAIKIQSGALDE